MGRQKEKERRKGRKEGRKRRKGEREVVRGKPKKKVKFQIYSRYRARALCPLSSKVPPDTSDPFFLLQFS